MTGGAAFYEFYSQNSVFFLIDGFPYLLLVCYFFNQTSPFLPEVDNILFAPYNLYFDQLKLQKAATQAGLQMYDLAVKSI